ncbi:MAG: hypothetical protein EVA87_02100 [Rhodospirillaceae bacterium]|nr:hypothetical protein [Rhodospirillaceae bacterium]RPG03430.1 MAG: hypothetical protein CBC23_001865 [Rhodospirillaceae bacterium TMED63]RZO39000.1 MAG: hypothetical protein EVA87_02100 [Rhodospirillaceae bacterium]
MKSVLSPVLVTPSVFDRNKITHRAIRPGNIFRTAVGGGGFVFGDRVSVTLLWGQSTIFESIRSSMTPPYTFSTSLLILGVGNLRS